VARFPASPRVETLSGGQRRPLDLALALVGDPDLIFLDEPATGFDPAARPGAWRLVESMCTLGRTIVLTSHYMDEVQHLADRAVLLTSGRIVAEGTPDSLRGSSLREAVISFRLAGVTCTIPPMVFATAAPISSGPSKLNTVASKIP
jgi:ABC-2 type transport system ATP-binding protein